MITLTGNDAITQAMRLAAERGLLPTALGSADLKEMTERLRENLFFSARTTNLWYVERLAKLVERYVKGEGRDNDLAQLRIEARKLLAQAGYAPEKGFPGDESLGIPPATPGSLRDLSSEKRLDLIFDTQAQMMRGLGMKLRGLQRADRWPAWELVRVGKFSSEYQREWQKRWDIAADNVESEGVAADGMLALKTSPIWLALGSSALFPDALNRDHPPFAFNSGMGWREVPIEEAREFGLVPAVQDYSQDPALKRELPGQLPQIFADAMAKQNLDPDLARVFGRLSEDLRRPDPPPGTDLARLARFKKLQAKFAQIDAARR